MLRPWGHVSPAVVPRGAGSDRPCPSASLSRSVDYHVCHSRAFMLQVKENSTLIGSHSQGSVLVHVTEKSRTVKVLLDPEAQVMSPSPGPSIHRFHMTLLEIWAVPSVGNGFVSYWPPAFILLCHGKERSFSSAFCRNPPNISHVS